MCTTLHSAAALCKVVHTELCYHAIGDRDFTATLCTAASRCVGKIPLLSERWPHRVQNNSIHVITIDASENEIKISRLNIH